MNTNTEHQTPETTFSESVERLYFALDGSNLGIWDWNIETGAIYFSPSWKQLFGFTEQDVIDHIAEWEKRIHPDDCAQIARDLQAHYNSPHSIYKNTYRLRANDNTYRWVEGRGKIVARAADGTPLRMIGTHKDITEQKESEEQYRHLFNITPLPTWIYDFETLQFLAVNQVTINHYGYTKEEFLNKTILDIRPAEYRDKVKQSLPNCDQLQNVVNAPWIHQKKNGELLVVELNSTSISYNGRKARLVVVNDITQKVAAEEELKRSHQQFLYASKATSDAIYDIDLKKNLLTWGEGFTTLFGYARNEVSLEKWEAFIHPDERHYVTECFYDTIYHTRKKFWKMEYRFLKQDATYRYVIDKGFILRDSEQQPLRVIGAMQDITSLKQQQLALAESNQRYEYATLAISDVIWDWVFEKDRVLWSDNYEKVTGWKLPDDKCLSVDTCVERFHESDRDRTYNSMMKAVENSEQTVWEAELKYLKCNGEIAHVYNRAYILRDEAGKAVRMIGAMQDITQRKKLEEQLLRQELEKQRVISKATIDAQERERSEIGKELHDNVNQVLTTTKLYLDLAQSHAEMREDLLQKSQKNIMYVIDEIRQLSRSLMNPSLGDLGLIDSINDLIEDIHATGKLRIEFKTTGAVTAGLPDNLELTIYRIIQEGLNNAVKHASASLVTVLLTRNNNKITLRIEDNGIGFDSNETKKGTGLKNIQNRVYLAGGSFAISTRPGAGCTLTIHFNI